MCVCVYMFISLSLQIALSLSLPRSLTSWGLKSAAVPVATRCISPSILLFLFINLKPLKK